MNAIATVFADPMLMGIIYSFDYTYRDVFVDVMEEIECGADCNDAEYAYEADFCGIERLNYLKYKKQITKKLVTFLDYEDYQHLNVGDIIKCRTHGFMRTDLFIITRVMNEASENETGNAYYGRQLLPKIYNTKDNLNKLYISLHKKYRKTDVGITNDGYLTGTGY